MQGPGGMDAPGYGATEGPMEIFPRSPLAEVKDPEPDTRPQAAPVLCDVCGASMQEHHCKLVCRCCGYTRDCSDP